MVTTFFFFVVA